jgi:hypothetical protein
MTTVVDHLELVDTEPDQPRETGTPVESAGAPADGGQQTMSALRRAAGRNARVWAD